MNIIIAGGREFNDRALVVETLNDFAIEHGLTNDTLVIVSGMAQGADKIGEDVARASDLSIMMFPAQWSKYGKSAGYKRNVQMADSAHALLAFWDGKSKGTGHMIDIANSKGLIVKVISYVN